MVVGTSGVGKTGELIYIAISTYKNIQQNSWFKYKYSFTKYNINYIELFIMKFQFS